MKTDKTPKNSSKLLANIVFGATIFITLLSLVGIYVLSTFYVSPFQKVYVTDTVNKVQSGGVHNYYVEMVLRPELRFDTNALLSKVTIDPRVDFTSKLADGVLTLDFGQSLVPDKQYTISFAKGTNLPTLDTYKYTFSTQKPTLMYLKEKNTQQSAIIQKKLGGETTILIQQPFILYYSMTPEYIVYAFRDNADYSTPAKVAVYTIENQSTQILPDIYDQFFDVITDEQSNQAILGKKDSSYVVLDMATKEMKSLPNIEGKYNSFLAFASPQFVMYNTVSFSNNTILYDLKNQKGTLIGKFTKVLNVNHNNGNVCLSALDSPDKVFVYSPDGKTDEIKLPVSNIDEIATNHTCDKAAYKTTDSENSIGFTTHIFDSKTNSTKIVSQEKAIPIGDFILDNSGTYVGYTIVIGAGKESYNQFILHDQTSFENKNPIESIKNATQVLIY
jgi:hypothetical protein